MEWNKHICVGVSVKRRSRRLRYQISHRRLHPTVYLIVCDRQADNRIEIIPSSVLLQDGYPHDRLCAIGIAGYKKEALEMLSTLFTQADEAGYALDVYGYLSGQERSQC